MTVMTNKALAPHDEPQFPPTDTELQPCILYVLRTTSLSKRQSQSNAILGPERHEQPVPNKQSTHPS